MLVLMTIITPSLSLAATSLETDVSPQPITTDTSFRWNNENWFTTPHPQPADFSVNAEREFFGTTTTGVPFSQTNVPNESGIRVQKFVIQDHYHYIVNGYIMYNQKELDEAILKEIEKISPFLVQVVNKTTN